ncbi:MAG: response regulator [Desulfobacterales bacterium]|nr:response regulator [Desulfobacterales bacterium]
MVKKILVVDDDKPLLRMLERFFQRQGYDFFGAANCKEASEILKKEKIDLVFSDIRLEEESGIELCREIRKKHPELYIAAMSGLLTEKETDECEKAGFNKVMLKPISLDEMNNFIKTL